MPDDKRRHFFVSFNQADRDWATWIAWVLEENDYSVFFQDWDFRGSFIEQMHQASQRAERTLVVLSDHYLHSEYARSEAWHRLTIDPVGREDSVVTVKVGPTTDLGLFSHFAYLDLTNTAEADAERLILERVRKAVDPDYRSKPSIRPRFPQKPTYPGPHNTSNPQPIPDNAVRKKWGLVRKFWPFSRQKNTGIILGFLLIVIASLALLLSGWNHPLRHFLSPSALRIRLDPPPSTADIWQALESGDYQAAINKAQICIELYAATARENQSTLAKMHEQYPPVGKVPAPEADKILERYALNSMATCLYLLGEASVNVGNIGDARNAYKGAMWYTYARDWDPPWFWSPAAAAGCRMQMDLDSWDHRQARAFADFLSDFNAARKNACRAQSQ